MAEKKKMTLESAMARLEEIVKAMEDDKLSLEKSLKLYEEGIGLVSMCQGELESAKRKIQILRMGKDGEIELCDASTAVRNEE
jgi:exodeoxyribonuclease VII small subunit